MNNRIVCIIFLTLSVSLRAEELVTAVSFSAAAESGDLRGGHLANGDILTVTAAPDTRFQLLIELADPGISLPVYALKGMVRYENVESDGYLQLDNHFGAKGTYFTKSLATAGPMGKLSGNSDWRPFVLPFYANSGDQADRTPLVPGKLSLGLFLPGSGSVSITKLALYQYPAGEGPLRSAGSWISERSETLLGAISGSLLGIWVAAIGVTSARGRARNFVFASTLILMLTGVVSLGIGIAAVASAQPQAIYYPFLLVGILLVAIVTVLRKTLAARYEQLELKKIRSMDA